MIRFVLFILYFEYRWIYKRQKCCFYRPPVYSCWECHWSARSSFSHFDMKHFQTCSITVDALMFSHANKSAVVFQAFIQNRTMIGLNESESCFHNRCWKERGYVHVCVRIFVPELDLEGHRDPTLPSRHSHLALPLRPTPVHLSGKHKAPNKLHTMG